MPCNTLLPPPRQIACRDVPSCCRITSWRISEYRRYVPAPVPADYAPTIVPADYTPGPGPNVSQAILIRVML